MNIALFTHDNLEINNLLLTTTFITFQVSRALELVSHLSLTSSNIAKIRLTFNSFNKYVQSLKNALFIISHLLFFIKLGVLGNTVKK